jgi:hypothetical protein
MSGQPDRAWSAQQEGGRGVSRRSREAATLARGLWTWWAMPPGSVEVRWTNGWYPDRWRWGWEVAWCDGPTVERIRHAAVHEVSGGSGIDALVRGGRVRYERGLSLAAFAVKLVTHVRSGGEIPELGDAWQAEAWQQELEQTDFPERAQSSEEKALAGLLVAWGLADYRRALAEWDRARAQGRRAVAPPLPPVLMCRAVAPPLPPVLMCRAVAAYGLDGLVALAQAEVALAARRSLDDGRGLDLG